MIPDWLIAALPETLGLELSPVRSQEATDWEKFYFSAGNSSARVFRFCILLEGASVAQSSVSAGLCARELPFGVLFEPETGFMYCATLGLDRLRAGRGGSEDSSFGEEISSTSAWWRKAREGLERPFFFATGCTSVALSSTDSAEPCV